MAQKKEEWNSNAPIRLDKFLAMSGIGTRSEVKKYLKNGSISVNGAAVKKPEQKVIPEKDEIRYNGEPVVYEPYIGIMFHKPAGCITATEDAHQTTVMDYIKHERKNELFPVGRLDIDTEGLLILTNDGELAHEMLSPRHHAPKTYFVRTDLPVNDTDREAFAAGVDIGEKNLTLPAVLKILAPNASSESEESEITITEGKFHQVKRMYAVRGKKVIYLKRIEMAGLLLDHDLKPGEWRMLSTTEMDQLRAFVKECRNASK